MSFISERRVRISSILISQNSLKWYFIIGGGSILSSFSSRIIKEYNWLFTSNSFLNLERVKNLFSSPFRGLKINLGYERPKIILTLFLMKA